METIADVKRQNAAKGEYFFSKETMKFFNSRIESDLIKGKYFITSEQWDDNPRKFTVREAVEGTIHRVGDFQQFETKAAAKEYIISQLPA